MSAIKEVDYTKLSFDVQFSLIDSLMSQCSVEAEKIIAVTEVCEKEKKKRSKNGVRYCGDSDDSIRCYAEREYDADFCDSDPTLRSAGPLQTDPLTSGTNISMASRTLSNRDSHGGLTFSSQIYQTRSKRKILVLSELQRDEPIDEDTVTDIEFRISELQKTLSDCELSEKKRNKREEKKKEKKSRELTAKEANKLRKIVAKKRSGSLTEERKRQIREMREKKKGVWL